MLVVSGTATAYLLFESFQQTSIARVARSEELVGRACRDIADRYQFFVSGRGGAPVDDQLKQQLVTVVQAAVASATGVEGGIWQADADSLAYAFPSYEGTGPKTDVPAAELNTIRQVNAEALQSGRPVSIRQSGRSQVLLVHACPLRGPLQGVTGWTMTRTFTAEGPAYNQLLGGLLVLALTIFGSAIWLARLLYSWSRKIALLENALRVSLERRRATAAERLAAVGRLSAGLAHEIRNPIAAMRLKAENALASSDTSRKDTSLEAILQQVARLDALLRDLLEMTQARDPKFADVELPSFLQRTVEAHRELAAGKGLTLKIGTPELHNPLPRFDPSQMQRALDNLILNAIQNTPAGGSILVDASPRDGNLLLRVADTGPGVSDDIRDRLFEPFATARSDGTGLGLAIVREIARNHGGDVRLVTTGGGATFEIEVPWRPS